MNRNFTTRLLTGVISLIAVGCAEATRRGVVVMKVDDVEAHVGLGAGEVMPGDRLTLFR